MMQTANTDNLAKAEVRELFNSIQRELGSAEIVCEVPNKTFQAFNR